LQKKHQKDLMFHLELLIYPLHQHRLLETALLIYWKKSDWKEQVLRERRSRHSRPIETALNYIHAHYAQPISMAEVAAQLYRSPEHFSRQFKEEVGENFSSYLTRYRLERAQELLQTTDLPVASVAVQTGYTTPGYFSRLYKKYKGVSPEAERRGSKS